MFRKASSSIVDDDEPEVKEEISEEFGDKWGWFVILDMLSNNDPTKWDEISEWNVIKFLNTIAYYKEKNALKHG